MSLPKKSPLGADGISGDGALGELASLSPGARIMAEAAADNQRLSQRINKTRQEALAPSPAFVPFPTHTLPRAAAANVTAAALPKGAMRR
jgi:AICAR transformylase/IMP cyclohydrolase PurH